MKSAGVTRKMDPLGRVVIPIEIRRSLDIRELDPLEIFVEGDKIILKKYAPGCQECGKVTNNLYGNRVLLCHGCVDTALNQMSMDPPVEGD